jgi:hypothetical protein
MNLIRLTYTSTLIGPPVLDDLRKLSERAAAHNAQQDVTGFLCYSGGLFLQALEGDEHVVNRIYHSRIVTDPMHEDLRILNVSSVMSREFEAWAMGFADVKPDDRPLVLRFFPKGSVEPARIDAKGSIAFLSALSAARSATQPR